MNAATAATDRPVDAADRCGHCCQSCQLTFSTANNPLPDNPSRSQRLRYALRCPIHGQVGRLLSLWLFCAFVYGAVWGVTVSDALPGGNLFALCILFACCCILGVLVEIIHLPSLLGMLIAGFALRNIPVVNVAKNIDPHWSSALRTMALTVILTRAGLGLDPVALRKLLFGVLRLAFTPCLIETAVIAITSHFIIGFPWTWAFMLGFVLAAVSPAVVVPSIIALSSRGYGVENGIATMIIAASSLDNIIAITGFGIVLSITFSQENLVWTILKGPMQIIVGIVYGVVIGVLFWFVPHRKHTHKQTFRFLLLMSAGIFATFGSRNANIGSAGPLGVLTMSFVSSLGWRKETPDQCTMPVAVYTSRVWIIFLPLMFGLIGAEIDISLIAPSTVGLGIAVMFIGVAARLIVAHFVGYGLGFTLKERVFIPLTWLPKATVQAAIGSTALDMARAHGGSPEEINFGIQILTAAVLSIVITAPIGAIAISITGPLFLHKSAVVPADNTDQVELCNMPPAAAAAAAARPAAVTSLDENN